MEQTQIIEHFVIMDSSIQKALGSGDVADLEQFHHSSELMTKEVPAFKGHLHIPKNLEYLLFHINFAPIYDYGKSYNLTGYKHRQTGYVLKD